MSESFWESEAAVETQPEVESEQGMELSEPRELREEPEPEARALAVSVDDFSALEQRIVRAVTVVKQERQGRAAAEQRAAQAEAHLREQAPIVDQMRAELAALKAERDHVRGRVERLLAQLDAIEL